MNKQDQDNPVDPLKEFNPASIKGKSSPSTKQPYEAYRLSPEPKQYLEIRVKFPEPAEYFPNAAITTMHAEWRCETGITLVYGSTRVIAIKGEWLNGLSQAIKDGRVEWLAEFNPDFHLPPTDDTAPFIRHIEILTERPEPPPPLHQRH